MSLRRQFRGVLEIVTPSGTQYLSPSVWERLYLIWIFRNFRMLQAGVLSKTERRRIESIAARAERVKMLNSDEIIGSVEFFWTLKKPVQSSATATNSERITPAHRTQVARISGD